MVPVQMTPADATDPEGAMDASTGVPTSASDAGARADLEDDASVDDDDGDEIDEEDDERGTQSATDAGERD